jgi:hypothetical protein
MSSPLAAKTLFLQRDIGDVRITDDNSTIKSNATKDKLALMSVAAGFFFFGVIRCSCSPRKSRYFGERREKKRAVQEAV